MSQNQHAMTPREDAEYRKLLNAIIQGEEQGSRFVRGQVRCHMTPAQRRRFDNDKEFHARYSRGHGERYAQEAGVKSGRKEGPANRCQTMMTPQEDAEYQKLLNAIVRGEERGSRFIRGQVRCHMTPAQRLRFDNDAEFEDKHPREPNGQFAHKGGGGGQGAGEDARLQERDEYEALLQPGAGPSNSPKSMEAVAADRPKDVEDATIKDNQVTTQSRAQARAKDGGSSLEEDPSWFTELCDGVMGILQEHSPRLIRLMLMDEGPEKQKLQQELNGVLQERAKRGVGIVPPGDTTGNKKFGELLHELAVLYSPLIFMEEGPEKQKLRRSVNLEFQRRTVNFLKSYAYIIRLLSLMTPHKLGGLSGEEYKGMKEFLEKRSQEIEQEIKRTDKH